MNWLNSQRGFVYPHTILIKLFSKKFNIAIYRRHYNGTKSAYKTDRNRSDQHQFIVFFQPRQSITTKKSKFKMKPIVCALLIVICMVNLSFASYSQPPCRARINPGAFGCPPGTTRIPAGDCSSYGGDVHCCNGGGLLGLSCLLSGVLGSNCGKNK